MVCPGCSVETPFDATICQGCGLRLQLSCAACLSLNSATHRFCKDCGWPLEAPGIPPSDSRRPVDTSVQTEAIGEHKQVTVLVCDIVDSTRVAVEIGPEAMHLLLNEFFRLSREEIHRYNGTVNQFLGDGFMALFGAPVAQEDHARLAVVAAMAIQERLALRVVPEGRPRLAVRIGINTGPVVVGNIGDNRRMDYTANGETTHLAARFQQRAAPGTILIGEVTCKLVRGYVQVEEIPRFSLKHSEQSLNAFKVVGVGKRRARLEVADDSQASFVGRAKELALLDRSLAEVESGLGQVVGISGEAGAGKSRLLHEFRLAPKPRPVTFLEGRCVSYGVGIPYLPIQDLVRAFCGITEQSSAVEMAELVHAALTQVGIKEEEHTARILQLLGVQQAQGQPPAPDPEAIRNGIFETLLAIAISACRIRPLVIAIEDSHWIDRLSEEYFSFFAEQVANLPILLIMTYRENFYGAWMESTRSTHISILPLTTEDGARVIESTARGAHVDEATTLAILDKAEGNPFFIEELTRSVVENAAHTLSAAMPETIQDILTARIDRLQPEAKLLLQISAVLGREFPRSLLDATCSKLGSISAQVDQLTRRNFFVNIGRPDPLVVFRHVLMQEAAYGSLLAAQRQRLHELAAESLEGIGATGAAAGVPLPVDLLAYHFSRSGNLAKEALYCQRAGEVAIQKGAYGVALDYVRRALEIVCSRAPADEQQIAGELALRLSSGSILLVVRGQGSKEAKAEYDLARELCRAMPPSPQLGRALFGVWTFYLFQGLMRQAEETVREIVALAEMANDPGLKIMARLAASQTYVWMGRWADCVEHTNEVFSLYDPSQHTAYVTQYAQNPKFTALGSAFWSSWALGRADQSMAIIRAGIEEARALNHDFTFVMAYLCLPLLSYYQRDVAALRGSIDGFCELAERAGNPFYIGLSRTLVGWLAAIGGDENGVRQIEAQREAMHAAGSKLAEPLMVTALADALLHCGQYAKGLKLLDDTEEVSLSTSHLACFPEQVRLRGELLLATGAEQAAEDCFRRAANVAREQGAKAWELRAELSLARLLRRLGRPEAARNTLAPVVSLFTEGRDAPDMVEANVLLLSL